MDDQAKNCPLCRSGGITPEHWFYADRIGAHVKIVCPVCGEYWLSSRDEESLGSEDFRLELEADRIASLLCEKKLRLVSTPPPYLHFGNQSEYLDQRGTARIRVAELLANWPASVAERIERAFCNLIKNSGGRLGTQIREQKRSLPKHMLFAADNQEANYVIDAITDYGWVNAELSGLDQWCGVVTPAGWEKYAELTRNRSNRTNPVFVAMWFGGDSAEQQERMTSFFENAIRPVCKRLGWLAERVDSQEHNDSIIDRIISMIRIAPFMIADLSDENRGVYYEAGYARGHGIEVIYLVKEGTEVHFDLSGVNHVRWVNEDDLVTKLENRIRGTIGRGPHSVP